MNYISPIKPKFDKWVSLYSKNKNSTKFVNPVTNSICVTFWFMCALCHLDTVSNIEIGDQYWIIALIFVYNKDQKANTNF